MNLAAVPWAALTNSDEPTSWPRIELAKTVTDRELGDAFREVAIDAVWLERRIHEYHP